MGRGIKLLGRGILNFDPCASRDHPKLSRERRDDPPHQRDAYSLTLLTYNNFSSINRT